MYTKLVQTNATGHRVPCLCWTIQPQALLDDLNSGRIRSVRELSWRLLSEPRQPEPMINHPGISLLDLMLQSGLLHRCLGETVLRLLRTTNPTPKTNPPFELVAAPSGQFFALFANDGVVEL